jgi:predicted nucleic acid-binding Zn ribbon protein
VRVACQHGNQDESWHEIMSEERDFSNPSAIGFWIIVAMILIAVVLAVLLKDAEESIEKNKDGTNALPTSRLAHSCFRGRTWSISGF